MDESLYNEGIKLAKEAGYGESEVEIWAKGYTEGREKGRKDGWEYYGGYGNEPKGGADLYEEGYKKGYLVGRSLGFKDRQIYGWQ